MSLELPFGIKPVNPVAVDYYSGPWSGASSQEAINAANSGIPSAVRFTGLTANLIIGGQAQKYWYASGVTDSHLVSLADTLNFSAGSPSGVAFFDASGLLSSSAGFTYDGVNTVTLKDDATLLEFRGADDNLALTIGDSQTGTSEGGIIGFYWGGNLKGWITTDATGTTHRIQGEQHRFENIYNFEYASFYGDTIDKAFEIVSPGANSVLQTYVGGASQAANLTEWQNDLGDVLAYVDSGGSASFRDLTVDNMTVSGMFTYVNSQNVTIADKQLELASNSGTAVSGDSFVDQGGIVVKSLDGDKQWLWNQSTDAWTSNKNVVVQGTITNPAMQTFVNNNALFNNDVNITNDLLVSGDTVLTANVNIVGRTNTSENYLDLDRANGTNVFHVHSAGANTTKVQGDSEFNIETDTSTGIIRLGNVNGRHGLYVTNEGYNVGIGRVIPSVDGVTIGRSEYPVTLNGSGTFIYNNNNVDEVNYERLELKWDTNEAVITTTADGTGTARGMKLQNTGGNFTIDAVSSAQITAGGAITLTAYSSIYQQFTTTGVGYRKDCYPIFNSSLDLGTNSLRWSTTYTDNIDISGALYDQMQSPGTAGQHLISTATGVKWTSSSESVSGVPSGVAFFGDDGLITDDISGLIYDNAGNSLGIGGIPQAKLDIHNGTIRLDSLHALEWAGSNNRLRGISGGVGGGRLEFIVGSFTDVMSVRGPSAGATGGVIIGDNRETDYKFEVVGESLLGTTNSTQVPATIQGAAAQSANLTEWQNSSSETMTLIDASGDFVAYASGDPSSTYNRLRITNDGHHTFIKTENNQGGNPYQELTVQGGSVLRLYNDINTGLYVGDYTVIHDTQTLRPQFNLFTNIGTPTYSYGDLHIESIFSSSGIKIFSSGDIAATDSEYFKIDTSISRVNLGTHGDGNGDGTDLYIYRDGLSYLEFKSAGIQVIRNMIPNVDGNPNIGRTDMRFGSVYSWNLDAESHSTTGIPLKVKGAASQSANLTEWQDSTGDIVASVDSVGNLYASGDISTSGGINFLEQGGSITTDSFTMYHRKPYHRFLDGGHIIQFNTYSNGYLSVSASHDLGFHSSVGGGSPDSFFKRRGAGQISVEKTGYLLAEIIASGVSASGLFLADHVPVDTNYQLYNDGGTLKWNGGGIDPTGTPSGVAFFGSDGLMTDDSAFVYDSGNSKLGLGTAVPEARLDITGNITSDHAELTTVSIAGKTGSGTNWSGTDVETGYAHTAGSADPLVTNITATTNKVYAITITVSNFSAGRFDLIEFGGATKSVYIGSNTTRTITLKTTNAGALELHPRSDFAGTVSIDNIEQVQTRDAIVTIRKSDNTIVNEIRTGVGDTQPYNSIYMGYQAGQSASGISGNQANTAIGYNALRSNVNGGYNTVFGYNNAVNCTDTSYLTLVGHNVLPYISNISKNLYNTAMGTNIAYGANFTGGINILIGNNIFTGATTAGNNVVVGYSAMRDATTNSYNIALGGQALQSNAGGTSNTAIGALALISATTGSYNIAIGRQAGRYYGAGTDPLTDSDNSILIGYNTKPSGDAETNQIVIGHEAIGNGSNSVTLGNTSITKTILNGDVGIDTSSPDAKLHAAATNATDVGIIAQAAAAQTANLTEWQNNTGDVIAHVDSGGSIFTSEDISASGSLRSSRFMASDDGSLAAPAFSFDSETKMGIYRSAANQLNVTCGANYGINLSPFSLAVASGTSFSWRTGNSLSGGHSFSTQLHQEANGVIGQYSEYGLENYTPQQYNIYNYWGGNTSNWERLETKWDNHRATIQTAAAGSGVVRDLVLNGDTIELQAGGGTNFEVGTDNKSYTNLRPSSNGSLELGSRFLRWKNIYTNAAYHGVLSTSTDATLGDNRNTVLCDASSNSITITLPASANYLGIKYHIKKTDSSSNMVTIVPDGSETIDGQSSYVVNNQYESITLVCDGSNWFII